ALTADRLQVDDNASLAGLTATGHDPLGAVRLLGAHITGQLNLRDARLTNDAGPALTADRLQVDDNASLAGLTATGHDPLGAVRLPGAHITGQLNLAGATLTNDAGPALHADSLQVDDSAYLADLTVTGHDPLGAVWLHSAHITGELTVSGLVAMGGRERVILDLRNAEVDGPLFLWDKTFWEGAFTRPDTDRPKVRLNGFTYRAQPEEPDTDTWLQVLRQCMPAYAPQPYRQLAEVCRAEGDEQRAKTALIAQQDAFGEALRHDDAPRRGARAWHWISRVTVRYGYRSTRALWFLLAVLAVSCALMLVADSQGWLVHPKVRGGGRCGVVETIGSAVDRTVPLLGFAVAGRCELTNTTAAQWVFVASLVLQVLSWVFLTLFVAGFTGIVRKPST
ncbi:hypothetical protein ACH4NT_36565, partial [Streptomyces lydicus]|uniref:hypothetical protein n=1 Tax=Streptomyces lydicus TaxID=47763 RepID=UPI0037B5B4E0